MIALLGAIGIIINDIAAMWIGYELGRDRGIEECRTKRGIRRMI